MSADFGDYSMSGIFCKENDKSARGRAYSCQARRDGAVDR